MGGCQSRADVGSQTVRSPGEDGFVQPEVAANRYQWSDDHAELAQWPARPLLDVLPTAMAALRFPETALAVALSWAST